MNDLWIELKIHHKTTKKKSYFISCIGQKAKTKKISHMRCRRVVSFLNERNQFWRILCENKKKTNPILSALLVHRNSFALESKNYVVLFRRLNRSTNDSFSVFFCTGTETYSIHTHRFYHFYKFKLIELNFTQK